MKHPRYYIDECGNERNGPDAQDAYDREQESKYETIKEEKHGEPETQIKEA